MDKEATLNLHAGLAPITQAFQQWATNKFYLKRG